MLSSLRRLATAGLKDVAWSGESGMCIAVSIELVCGDETLEAVAAVDFRLAVLRPGS